MQVPQVLLDRRAELKNELEAAGQTVSVALRQEQMARARLDEMETAIVAIEVMQGAPQVSEPVSFEPEGHRCSTGHPGVSGEAAEKQSSKTGRTRRPIRDMILSELEHAQSPMTVKEIMHAVQAPKQVVLKALVHHYENGKATRVEGARWAAIKPEAFPIEFSSSSESTGSAETATENPHIGSSFDDWVEEQCIDISELKSESDEGEHEEKSESETVETTKDKIVRLLTDNPSGMTDDGLAARGVPYLAAMQYRESGLLTLKYGRNFLNPEAIASEEEGA